MHIYLHTYMYIVCTRPCMLQLACIQRTCTYMMETTNVHTPVPENGTGNILNDLCRGTEWFVQFNARSLPVLFERVPIVRL